MLHRFPLPVKMLGVSVVALACFLGGCSSTVTVTTSGATSTPTTGPTATPQPPCISLVPGSTPFSSLSGIPGIQLPARTSISVATSSGGGQAQYSVNTYTLCFPGSESAIDGGILTKPATPSFDDWLSRSRHLDAE